jgi:energy-coupling factor transporter ATP-binding protein EcfA2
MEQMANELEEYVVTPELQQHLNTFLDEYNERNATGNGAWIFGFFGSGKSHLLKMLAVLLEDREVDGKRASEYFLPKVASDKMLENSIRAAIGNHPSESLLFNIDSKAPSREVPGTASLLVAFIKVFFEKCGYYAEDAIHIGAIERDLDNKGVLDEFKRQVEAETGKGWETVRKAASLYAKGITKVFDEVNGHALGTTTNIVTYYQETFAPSIEDFAGWVADYNMDTPPLGGGGGGAFVSTSSLTRSAST